MVKNKPLKQKIIKPKPSNSNKQKKEEEKKKVIEKTKKAFAPPTKRQLEQQAQARARGGLTSRGIRKFKSKTEKQQQAEIQKQREKVGLPKEGVKPKDVKIKPIDRPKPVALKQQEQKQFQPQQFVTGSGLFQKVSFAPTEGISEAQSVGFVQREFKKDVRIAKRIPTATERFKEIQLEQREKIKKGESSGFFAPAIGFTASVLGTLEFGKQLITSPVKTTKETVAGIKQIIKEPKPFIEKIKTTIKEEPGFAAGFVAGEIVSAKGAATVPRATRVVRTVVSPKFKPVIGKKIKVPTTKGVKEIKIAGPISEFAQPVKEQAKFAGELVDAVSAQRSLFPEVARVQKTPKGKELITKEIRVDKPKPKPTDPELERAFFADPEARLRPSRLGLTEKASIREGISFKLRREKPQALIFPETKVEAFPKELIDVQKALRTGKTLTPEQAKRFEKFQMKPTGEFKPVGFISTEPEITLAPGEIIRKQKKLGATIIKGERVQLIEAKVVKATPELTEALITKPTKAKTIRKLRKETGLDISRPPRGMVVTPVESLKVAPSLKVRPSISKKVSRVPSVSISPKLSKEIRVSKPIRQPFAPSLKIISVSPSIPSPRITSPIPSIPRPISPRPGMPKPPSPIIPRPISPRPPTPISRTTKPIFPKIKLDQPIQTKKIKLAKQLDITTQYRASLVGIAEKIKETRRPRVLTGLEVRGIRL